MDKRYDTGVEGNKHKGTRGRMAGFIAAGVGAVLFITYAAGVLYFQGHYYRGTVIDDMDYSYADIQESKNSILNPDVPYMLKLVGREGMEYSISAADIGMFYQFDDSLTRFNESQPGWKWPVMLFHGSRMKLNRNVVYDDALLDEILRDAPFFREENRHEPENAAISDYQPEKGYSIIPEYPGTMLDFRGTAEKVREALSDMAQQLDLTGDDLYTQPAVLQEDSQLRQLLDTANRYLQTVITYRWNGETEVVDAGLIHEWVRIEDGTVSLDEEQVKQYVAAMAKKHDTYGRDRDFITSAGDTIRLRSGSYGWWTDRAGETAALTESVRKGEKAEREPLYHSRGYVEGAAGEDIGSSYVEIDLGKQHLFLYIEGTLILESDFVSGNIVKGRGTPAGVFGLTYKERNATLRGENYASPVKYWMPFNGNIGMHDASWRTRFGGDIYMRQGSHGCINLPGDKAEELYGYIQKGFPVICYY